MTGLKVNRVFLIFINRRGALLRSHNLRLNGQIFEIDHASPVVSKGSPQEVLSMPIKTMVAQNLIRPRQMYTAMLNPFDNVYYVDNIARVSGEGKPISLNSLLYETIICGRTEDRNGGE